MTPKNRIIKVGRLISTTDTRLARKLGKIIKLEAITRGKMVRLSRIAPKTYEFIFRGELYEIEEVSK